MRVTAEHRLVVVHPDTRRDDRVALLAATPLLVGSGTGTADSSRLV